MWVVVSTASFQLCNIEPEPQQIEIVCFLKLNNTLEYFESNLILFWVLQDFLKIIFDKVYFLVKCVCIYIYMCVRECVKNMSSLLFKNHWTHPVCCIFLFFLENIFKYKTNLFQS